MLMGHVQASLSESALGSAGVGGDGSVVSSSARVQSYFQVMLRPSLANRGRDEKELYTLAVALDTLRCGNLERLSDILASRFLAVETAALEGDWSVAKYLEVSRLPGKGAVSDELLLEARKHRHFVDRASGRGSYPAFGDGSWGQRNHGGTKSWKGDPGGGFRNRQQKGKKGHGKGVGGKKGKQGWKKEEGAKGGDKPFNPSEEKK